MARAVPSGRDLRKYARLFVRTDHDSDGFISADEAKAVFNKSYLPPDVLINIFNQANVSQSPYLSFPEFVAAMHLIREARHSQQSPSISAELMNFLSNLYESPWDLAIQGSSKSAQALKQSPQFNHINPTHSEQADPSFGQEKSVADAVPPTPDFPSAGNFGEAPKRRDEFPNEMSFGDPDLGFAQVDKAEKEEKGKRKKEKKEKKHKQEDIENKEQSFVTEQSFGADWTSFGQDPSGIEPGGEIQGEIRESWPSFGNEHEMSFGIDGEDKKDKPKQKRRQKDQKDLKPDFPKDLKNADDFQTPKESFVPHFGQDRDRTDRRDRPWDLDTLPQPSTPMATRFGLPVGSPSQSPTHKEHSDPDYVARLEEILGVAQVQAEAVHLDKRSSQWAGRRHDGHFEERYRTAFMDLGDYASPGVYVSLMGLKSHNHTAPRVLPESAKPFLKSLTPNFQAGALGRSRQTFDLLRMR